MWTSAANAESLLAALHDFGFRVLGPRGGRLPQPGRVEQLGDPPLRVDLPTSIDGVDVEPCFERRVEIAVQGLRVPFIALDDLRRDTAASGRLQDLAGLAALDEWGTLPDDKSSRAISGAPLGAWWCCSVRRRPAARAELALRAFTSSPRRGAGWVTRRAKSGLSRAVLPLCAAVGRRSPVVQRTGSPVGHEAAAGKFEVDSTDRRSVRRVADA